MSDSIFEKIIEDAQCYHRKNSYDIDEMDMRRMLEDTQEKNWHHSLALAVNILEISSIEKLRLFSECIRRQQRKQGEEIPF